MCKQAIVPISGKIRVDASSQSEMVGKFLDFSHYSDAENPYPSFGDYPAVPYNEVKILITGNKLRPD